MNCKNCEKEVQQDLNFCPECGAKVIKQRLTLKNIWTDVVVQFFDIDNTLLKTFLHLSTKPEAVINGFINGTRKKYVNVIQYFALSLTLAGIQLFLLNTFFAEALAIDTDFLTDYSKLENQENNPFKDYKFADWNNYQSVFYIISVPISAIASWLAFWLAQKRRFNFTEHVVINLYYSAQIIIVNSVLSIIFLCFGFNYLLISSYITVFLFGYFYFVLKRVFALKFWDSVIHFLLVMIVYIVLFLIIGILSIIAGVIVALILKNNGGM